MKSNTSWPSWSRKYSATVNPLIVQIVTLTGSLSNTGKHGVTTMSLGNIVNQFHDEDSLADSSTAEQTNLSSLGVWGKQVHNLDA